MKFDYNQLGKFDKIYVLVSGGFDSTYLYDKIKTLHPTKTIPVNCYNPYENSDTLKTIGSDPKFIQVRPYAKVNYGDILRKSFEKLPEAYRLKQIGAYHKKIFPCCYYIKHKAFLNDPQFKEPNTVVISGIKRGDGQQRFFWLYKLWKENRFFHEHKGGQLYCYPFRDYNVRELPNIVVRRLRKKYPTLDHSGCSLCPVLVLFNIKEEKRFKASYNYAHKLGVLENHLLMEYA